MRSKAEKAAAQREYKRRKMQDPQWTAKRRAADRAYWLRNRERVQFNTARHQAKKRGLEFTLRFEDVTWPEFCPVFGVRLERVGDRTHGDWSPSMDRVDSTKGYVPGNVIVVSMRANRIKSNATPEELQQIARFYGRLSLV
jgi:hypothetical protein